MKINNPEKRLSQFWGRVDQKHISAIAGYVQGKRVLDMGCGLGTTTCHLTALGHEPIGIDYDAATIGYCKDKYPHCHFKIANAEQLPFDNGNFDTIVLRDALHHFYGEANFEMVKAEILRVAKDDARIIFFDPNVNLLIKTMRRISFHKDEECDYETANKIMSQMGFTLIHKEFNTVYSLPLSGGYVGLNFIPNVNFIQKAILGTEKIAERVINKIGLGRHLCWRYMIVGQRTRP